MRKKWLIRLLIPGLFFLASILYTNRMEDYGIRSKWKALLLNTILSKEVPKISVADAAKEKEKVLFLDTRSTSEFEVSHLKGAYFIGFEEFDLSILKNISKEQRIVTYCSIGKRSDVIGKKLIEAGYKQVQNMYGGIFEWINAGHPVVDNRENETDRVHTYNQFYGAWLNRGTKVH